MVGNRNTVELNFISVNNVGSNDPFVTIGLGKEKFQTTVIEKSGDSVEWMEQCEL